MRNFKLKKTIKVIPTTSEYLMFEQLIREELNMEFKSIFTTVGGNEKFGTIDGSSNLKITVKSRIIEFFNDKFRLVIHPINNGVNIHIIEVSNQYRNKGLGRKLMNIMIKISNILDIPLFLVPVKIDTVPVDVLRNFYHSLDFKRTTTSRYWKYNPTKVIRLDVLETNYKMVG